MGCRRHVPAQEMGGGQVAHPVAVSLHAGGLPLGRSEQWFKTVQNSFIEKRQHPAQCAPTAGPGPTAAPCWFPKKSHAPAGNAGQADNFL